MLRLHAPTPLRVPTDAQVPSHCAGFCAAPVCRRTSRAAGWFVQLWWIVQALVSAGRRRRRMAWRRWLLRRFGAKIGKGVQIRPTAEITYPWKLTIGGLELDRRLRDALYPGRNPHRRQRRGFAAFLHLRGVYDYAVPTFDRYDDPVRIEAEAWIAAGVFVAPGISVGRGAVVGARSVVLSDLPATMICAGHPAKVIRPRLAPQDEPVASHSEYVCSLQA